MFKKSSLAWSLEKIAEKLKTELDPFQVKQLTKERRKGGE